MNTKSLHDLEASFAVISSNVTAYHAGNVHAYRPVAVELRKLLCDTQAKTNNSLMKRLFPDFRLHLLSGNQNSIDEHTSLYIPGQVRIRPKINLHFEVSRRSHDKAQGGRIASYLTDEQRSHAGWIGASKCEVIFGRVLSFDGRGDSSLYKLFNESAPSLFLNEWLQQKLFDFTTTIKDFIRSVADKEGAHSDESYNTVLRKAKSVVLTDDTLAAKAILAIGRYAIKTLAIRMVNDNIAKIGAHVIDEYNRIGRGVAVLSLAKFATRFLEGVPIKYEPASTAEAYFQRDPSKCESAMQILQVYQPSGFFILLVKDINGEIWLYQQALKTET